MNNEANEKIILNCMIQSPTSLPVILEKLQGDADYFYYNVHQLLFSAIKLLFEQKIVVNLTTLTKYFIDINKFDEIRESLLSCMNCWTGGNIDSNIQSLIDDKCRRDINSLLKKAGEVIPDKNFSIDVILNKLDYRLKEIIKNDTSDITYMSDMATDKIEDLSPFHRYIKTPWKDLNENIHGLFQGELTILAARPSVGKTAAAGNIAVHVAEHNMNEFVLFFSLEMSKTQIRRRFISQYARVNSFILKTNKYETEQQRKTVYEAMKKVDTLNLAIVDTKFKLDDIISISHRFKYSKPVSLIVVDYLQLIEHYVKGSNRDERVGDIAQKLKQLAKELNIPVLCLAQLNRAIEIREDSRPQLSDLRESGSIEAHADNVYFLFREKKEDLNNIILYVAKQRDGKALFDVNLYFNREYTLFENL